jgi:hypothetical protein
MTKHLETVGGLSMFGSVAAHAWKVDADGGERAIVPIVMMTSRPPGHTSLDVTGIAVSELQSIAGKLAPSELTRWWRSRRVGSSPAKWKARAGHDRARAFVSKWWPDLRPAWCRLGRPA